MAYHDASVESAAFDTICLLPFDFASSTKLENAVEYAPFRRNVARKKRMERNPRSYISGKIWMFWNNPLNSISIWMNTWQTDLSANSYLYGSQIVLVQEKISRKTSDNSGDTNKQCRSCRKERTEIHRDSLNNSDTFSSAIRQMLIDHNNTLPC